MRQVNFDNDKLNKLRLSLKAVARKKDVPLKHERIDVPDSAVFQYDMQPGARLETRPRPDDPFILVVELHTNGLALGREFKLELSSPEAPLDSKTQRPTPLKLPTKPKPCIRYKPQGPSGHGVVDAEGILRAEVNVTDVSAALAGGKQYTLYAVPLSAKLQSLTRHTSCNVPEPLHQSLEEEAGTPFMGMWPEGANSPMKGEGLGF